MTGTVPAILMIIIAAFLFTSCGSNTEMVGSWGDPDYKTGEIDKVLIVAMAKDLWRRSMFEKTLVRHFSEKGVEAISSLEVLPRDKEINREVFELYFGDQNIDAVFIVRLMDKEIKTKGVIDYSVPYHYGSFYGYYSLQWGYVHTSTYTIQDKILMLEGSLFETTDAKLIWNGLSETVNPEKLSELFEPYSYTVVRELKSQKIIK